MTERRDPERCGVLLRTEETRGGKSSDSRIWGIPKEIFPSLPFRAW